VIIGCEPEDTTSMKIELTNRVMESVPKIIELVMEELKSSS
jgi:Ni,Fe-hydrogenase maturation factor